MKLLYLTLLTAFIAGVSFSNALPTPQERNNLAEKQLKAMLTEIPEMAKHVVKDDVAWNWALTHFAASHSENPIFWDATPPQDSRWEGFSYGFTNDLSFIQLARLNVISPDQGKPRNFDSLWNTAIMELINSNNAHKVVKLNDSAVKGKYSREEYIWETARIEYENFKELKDFFKKTWQPYCDAKKIATDEYRWSRRTPDSFEEFKAHFKDRNYYPWTVFGPLWERVIEPAKKNKEKYKDTELELNDSQLTKEQILNSNKKLKAVLAGHPTLNKYNIGENDMIWRWCVNNLSVIKDVPDIENKYSSGIATGIEKGFQQLWFDFIYSVIKARKNEETSSINKKAAMDKTDDEIWALERRLEFETKAEVVKFYFKIWEPFCEKNKLIPDFRMWYAWWP